MPELALESQIGQVVKVVETSDQTLNNSQGVVIGFSPAKQRYVINVQSKNRIVALRPTNLIF